MRQQLSAWVSATTGDRELASCHPDYYKWTQWLFLQFFKRGLAYRKQAAVNWCPSCATVLANEQVVQGGCERCDTAVTTRAGAVVFQDHRLRRPAAGGPGAPEGWPEKVKTMQRNWIGSSEGVEIRFPIKGTGQELPVFTTRPDTVFGVTYMVMAPEHPWVPELIADRPDKDEIAAFIERVMRKGEIDADQRGRRQGGHLHWLVTASTPSPARRSPSTWATTSWRPTAPARLWPCPPTTSATLSLPGSTISRYGSSSRASEPLDGETMTEAYTGPGDGQLGRVRRAAERRGLAAHRRRLEPSGAWASGK